VGLAPALLASYLAASSVAMALSPRARQLRAVRDAARSAELFFRLDRAHRRGASVGDADDEAAGAATAAAAASAGGAAAAAEAGDAFRRLSLQWARDRLAVARLAFALSAVELLYLHQVWASCAGDCSAAVGCLTAAWAAELLLAWRAPAAGDG
jgi:hypothetical protein